MQKLLGASWATTLAGISTILIGLGNAILEFSKGGFAAVNWTVLFAAVTTGVGLIVAKDANVSNAPAPAAAKSVPAP